MILVVNPAPGDGGVDTGAGKGRPPLRKNVSLGRVGCMTSGLEGGSGEQVLVSSEDGDSASRFGNRLHTHRAGKQTEQKQQEQQEKSGSPSSQVYQVKK